MSEMEELPRKYYDFDYLLRPAPRLSVEARREFVVDLIQSGQEGRDALIDCAINAFLIHGDVTYSTNLAAKNYVGTETSISSAKTEFKATTNTVELMSLLKAKVAPWPIVAAAYNTLLDFEINLIKQKKLYRSKGKSA